LEKKNKTSFEQFAKAFTRIGTCYFKLEKYDLAINYLNDAITESRNKQTLELLEKIYKIKKKNKKKKNNIIQLKNL